MWRQSEIRGVVGLVVLGNTVLWVADRFDDRVASTVAVLSGAALFVAFRGSRVARTLGVVLFGLAVLTAFDLGLLPVIRF